MLTIPPDLDFADLALEFGPDGGLLYQPEPLKRIAVLNGCAVDAEDDAIALLTEWYVAHREAGGAADTACETIGALLHASQ